ncbi:hypothetical protein ACR9E3_09630 [Actinomycetospora sp. C-140]
MSVEPPDRMLRETVVREENVTMTASTNTEVGVGVDVLGAAESRSAAMNVPGEAMA